LKIQQANVSRPAILAGIGFAGLEIELLSGDSEAPKTSRAAGYSRAS
jgi:hypothetical protein